MASSEKPSKSAAEKSVDLELGTATSSSNKEIEFKVPSIPAPPRLDLELKELFSENVVAKIWNVAVRLLKEQNNLLTHYPETVPQTGPNAGKYDLREAVFWTCGFFPGSLYLLLERATKYPQYLSLPPSACSQFHQELLKLARTWAEPICIMAKRTDTHDVGFMIQPSFRMDWELTSNEQSLETVVTAAKNLMSRYDERVEAIRSWDKQVTKRYSYTDKEVDFLVIVDSMCRNGKGKEADEKDLDLLFYAGHHTGDQDMINVAIKHATTVLKHVVRGDFSTFHLVVFDAKTGGVKERLTCQGYKDESTWSRGQAWAILGFTQTYIWTKDPLFLHASIALANYFLSRLNASPYPSPYVPLWDFDAPVPLPGYEGPLRDTSAGMIAANGMLLLSQILAETEEGKRFLKKSIRIVRETVELSLDKNKAMLQFPAAENDHGMEESRERFDAILRNATANANEDALRRYWDHGLVYADYYFLEFGNKLLRMGLL